MNSIRRLFKRLRRDEQRLWRKEQRFVRRHKSIHVGWVILSSAVLCLLVIGSVFALVNPGELTPQQPIIRTVQQGVSSETGKVADAAPVKPSNRSSRVAPKTATLPKAQPCTKAAPIVAQPLAISVNNPGLQTNTKTSTYDVFGNTANEIREQLTGCSPYSPYDAYTSWYINWQYGFLYADEDGCKLTDATVGVQVHFLYPKWQTGSLAESGLSSKWQSYMTKLVVHEEGHRSRYLQYGQKILSTLQTIPPQNDCSVIEAEANEGATRLLGELKRIDLAYDDETKHGETQGAVFP